MGSPSFIPLSQLQQPAGSSPVISSPTGQDQPDFIPLNQLQSGSPSKATQPDFISHDELQETPPEVSDPNEGTLSKIWRHASTPLIDLHRQDAGPIESGVEKFASGLTSPLSIGLMITTGGLGSLAEGAGASALESFAPEIASAVKPAAAFASKAMNLGFTANQIVDVAKNVPQISSAISAGDTDRAIEMLTETALNAGAAGLSAMHLTKSLRSKPFSFEGDSRALGEYQHAVELGNATARDFEQSNKDLIRNKPLDSAALLYHEAGGDNTALENWRNEILDDKNISDKIKGKYDAVLKLAQNLPQNVKDLSAQLREDYANDWQRGQQSGIFDPGAPGRQNYAGRHEYVPNSVEESSVRPSGIAGTKNPAFAKARTFDTLIDAIKQGYEPLDQGLAASRSKYIRQLSVSEGLRAAEQKLQETTATKDSAPIGVAPSKVRTISGQRIDSFPTRIFHGTSADVADVHGLKPEEFGVPGRLGTGAYFSLSPDVASKYAGPEVQASGGRVVAGELSDGVKLLDADTALPKKLRTALGAGEDDTYGDIIREAIQNKEDSIKIQKAISDAGYDGVRSEDVHGAPGILMFGQDVTGRPLSEVIDPVTPTLERAMGDKARNVRAIPVPQNADLDMLAASGRLINGENGNKYIDVSDYKEGPDKFNLYRVKQTAFDENGESMPIFERRNLLVHPDFHESVMRSFQDESWFRKNAFSNALLKASTQAKKSLLSLSPFHLLTEAERGLQMGLSPAEVVKPPQIDPDGLAMTQGTKHGLTLLGDAPGRNQFAEGVGQNAALLHKIPVLGNILHAAEDHLFSSYIPKLKALAFDRMSESLAKINPEWSDAQVYTTAAHLSNSAFGGLNWKMLGKSLTGQDFLRLTMLAPDFTGSQYYFAKAGFQPGGSQVWQSFARISAYNLLVAQTLNMLNTGKIRMDHPFSVVSDDGKNIYNVRSMPEDIAHALTDPRGFSYNRLNPITTKPVIEFLTGKDQQGRNASYGQQLTDLLKNVVPMPVQSIGAQDPAGQFMRSFGVARQPNRSAAENLAIQKASARSSQGAIPQEQLDAHRHIRELTDQLREGQISNQQVVQELRNGTISRQTAERILKDSKMTPLVASVSNLPIADALDIYELATFGEKKDLHQLMMKKVEGFGKTQADRTPQANAFLANRIHRTLGLQLGVPTHRFVPGVGIQQIQ